MCFTVDIWSFGWIFMFHPKTDLTHSMTALFRWITSFYCNSISRSIMSRGRAMRKWVFGHMRTATDQLFLHFRTEHTLSANRIFACYRMYQWRENARTGLCACAEWIWMSILQMFVDTFLLGTAQVIKTIKSSWISATVALKNYRRIVKSTNATLKSRCS